MGVPITKEECQRRIFEKTPHITLTNYINAHKSGLHCDVCGQDWIGNPSSIYMGIRKCPICVNQKIVRGYNDLWTTHPDIAKLLQNPEDGYNVSFGSGKKFVFICPECGTPSRPTQLCNVTKHGFRCHTCGDGISIPNKFMSNILKEILGYEYECEKVFDWCKFSIDGVAKKGIYDFYFKYNGEEYIVEMDGGIGHGNKFYYPQINKNYDFDYFIKVDNEKDRLATEHGIKVIRIEATDSSLSYLKEKVLNSYLPQVLNLDKIDFQSIYQKCLKSLMIEAINIFNSKTRDIKKIAKELKVSHPTALSYIKRGTECNLCKYDPIIDGEKIRKINHAKQCHPVINTTENIRFDSVSQASSYYKIYHKRITNNCEGLTDYAFINSAGEQVRFKYAS